VWRADIQTEGKLTLSSTSAATTKAVGYEENCWCSALGTSPRSNIFLSSVSPGEISNLGHINEWTILKVRNPCWKNTYFPESSSASENSSACSQGRSISTTIQSIEISTERFDIEAIALLGLVSNFMGNILVLRRTRCFQSVMHFLILSRSPISLLRLLHLMTGLSLIL